MGTDLTQLTAHELLDLYRRRKASPVEAVDAVLERVAKHNGLINAFAHLDPDSARAAARKSEKRWKKGKPRGALEGVPVTIKELLQTKGWPTVMASKLIDANQKWEIDAPAVARLREAGAVLLGKVTSSEFGYKGVTDSPVHGITRNPWHPDRTPGGSSGGGGAAVAAGFGPVSIGTDGGGSVRIPASFCGLIGLKATLGRVPAFPPSMHGDMANTGPLTRDVEDCALLLNVISQPDVRDWYSLPPDDTNYVKALKGGVKKLKIAFSPNLGYAKVDGEVAKAVAKAAKIFADLGAKVEQVDPPIGALEPGQIFLAHWLTSAARLLKQFPESKHNQFDPGLLQACRAGQAYTTEQLVQAQYERRLLGHAYNMFFGKYDLLLTPTVAVPAFGVGLNAPVGAKGETNPNWTPFTFVFNLTRHPAITVPCGVTKDGLPIGLQIVAGHYRDALLLRAAQAYTKAAPIRLPKLPVSGKSK